MASPGLAALTLVVAASISAVAVSARTLSPRAAARMAGAGLIAAGLATVWSLVGLASTWVAGVLHSRTISIWCDHLYRSHNHVPAWAGLASAVALVVVTCRAGAVLCRRRCLTDHAKAGAQPGVQVIPEDRPRGFALPGRPGRVVITTGLIDALEGEQERRAVLAHEFAHLHHQHYRFLLAGDLAVAVAPFLGPLRSRMQFALERWADETAVQEIGDRRVVARAIAHAALAGASSTSSILGVSSTGVPARVEALLVPPSGRKPFRLACAVALLAFAGAATLLQLHHVAVFVAHLC
jgi:hypothetical protein